MKILSSYVHVTVGESVNNIKSKLLNRNPLLVKAIYFISVLFELFKYENVHCDKIHKFRKSIKVLYLIVTRHS